MARFVAKRGNVSFEGCAFKNFGFQTDDVGKIEKLRNSKFYHKGFIEIDKDDELGTSFNKPIGQASIEELKRQILLKEGAETTKFEEVEEVNAVSIVVDETITNAETPTTDTVELTDYTEWSYTNLKEEAKKQGMKWKGFPKKTDLIEYLNAEK